jgi:hypothetical protein
VTVARGSRIGGRDRQDDPGVVSYRPPRRSWNRCEGAGLAPVPASGGAMKYLILGLITESGQQLPGPDLEAWMQEIGAWYEKWGSAGKLADPGHQLGPVDQVKTIRSGGVTDGPYMESKEVLGGYSLPETDTIDEAVQISRTWPGVDRGLIVMEVRPVMAM